MKVFFIPSRISFYILCAEDTIQYCRAYISPGIKTVYLERYITRENICLKLTLCRLFWIVCPRKKRKKNQKNVLVLSLNYIKQYKSMRYEFNLTIRQFSSTLRLPVMLNSKVCPSGKPFDLTFLWEHFFFVFFLFGHLVFSIIYGWVRVLYIICCAERFQCIPITASGNFLGFGKSISSVQSPKYFSVNN